MPTNGLVQHAHVAVYLVAHLTRIAYKLERIMYRLATERIELLHVVGGEIAVDLLQKYT